MDVRGSRVRSASPTSVPMNRSGFGTANGLAVFVDFGVLLHGMQKVGTGRDKTFRILQIKPKRGSEVPVTADEKSEGLGVAVNLAAIPKIEPLGDGSRAFKTAEGVFDGLTMWMCTNGTFSSMSGQGSAAFGSGLSGQGGCIHIRSPGSVKKAPTDANTIRLPFLLWKLRNLDLRRPAARLLRPGRVCRAEGEATNNFW